MKYILAIATVFLAFSISCSKPYIRVSVVNTMPEKFMEIMQGGKSVGIVKRANAKVKFRNPEQQKAALDEIENSLQKARYFSIIDIDSRQDRLQEIAYTQTGVTKDETEVGREFNLQGIIYLSSEAAPKYQCETKYTTEKKMVCPDENQAACPGVQKVEKKFDYVHKIASYTLFLNARLVNVATGQSLGFSQSDPVSIERKKLKDDEDTSLECASEDETFAVASKRTAAKLTAQISPTVVDMQVLISDDKDGIPKENRSQIMKILEQGNKWALSGNFDQAQKNWQEVLDLSEQQALAPYWNLAVLYWSSGDLEKAEKFFKIAVDDADFVNEYRMKTFSKFQSEKKRILIEQRKSGEI